MHGLKRPQQRKPGGELYSFSPFVAIKIQGEQKENSGFIQLKEDITEKDQFYIILGIGLGSAK